MSKKIRSSNTLVITLIVIIVVLSGSILLLVQNKNQTVPKIASTNSDAISNDIAIENTTYGHVHALFRNPADHTLLMGTHDGLFKSTDDGKTFTKVNVKGDVQSADFMNFAYDRNAKTLYAGGHDLGIMKSTDGGITWIKTDTGITGTDIHALAINLLDTNRLFAFSVDHGVFGTKDGAKSWYRIDDGPPNPGVRAFGYMGTPSDMDRSMKTDNTTNIGYLWGGTSGGLYSSFACFCGWTKSSFPDNATIYTLAPDPVNRSRMLIGTKDGIFQTTDEGKTFAQISQIKDIAAIAFDLTNPDIAFAVTTNGTFHKSTDGGKNWQQVN